MTTKNLTFENDPSFGEARDGLIALIFDNVEPGERVFQGIVESLMGLIMGVKPAVLIDPYINSTGLLDDLNREYKGDFVLIGKFIVNLSLLQERIEKEWNFLESLGYEEHVDARALVQAAESNEGLCGFVLGFPISAIESYDRAQEARAHGPNWHLLLLAVEDLTLAEQIKFSKIPSAQRGKLREINEEFVAMINDINNSTTDHKTKTIQYRKSTNNFLDKYRAYFVEILRTYFNVSDDDLPYLTGAKMEPISMPGYHFVTEFPLAEDLESLRQRVYDILSTT